ncbi:tripartite tricarboxylate transporter TctB family protein [Pannonibacter sp.]|uniref:tripartite tricarboxylate transporter TctB family protein n=1 Tax=Pannonibacter sp. TaxID=1906786 RepID=UPI003F6EE397
MADRIFAGVLLLVALGYTYIAFTVIKAPFQYDPVGPEGWPRLLGLVAIICAGFIVIRPEIPNLNLTRATLLRLAVLVALLFGYAAAYEPVGFILSTWAFCTVLSLFLGATPSRAVVFGAASGILGYAMCTVLLNLNLPAGILKPWL